ncbi:unnamed protein product [Blepharisma stoltei]|uniref:Protein phosphatase n=1 Tax=Blepharisma stoltei TaxID=1481888 RepID=A0AAU9K1K4_9CILI|nr:unnamed protein product [Blepharisma stoltei]
MLTRTLRRFSSFTNHFRSAAWSVPSPEKQNTPPDDAYFANDRAMAVADGISGWKQMGVDPSKYAWELMQNVSKSIVSLPDKLKFEPQAVLKDATKNTKETGSSTCTLAIFDPELSKLYTANIGDSGFMIYRKKGEEVELIARSQDVIHSFNSPCQLGTDGDSPDIASYEVIEVQDKDLIVMYTDGLTQNMFDDQILRMIKPFMLLHEIPDLEIIAEMVAERALEHSTDTKFESPYMLKAKSEKIEWVGGKPNDITVLVGQINLKEIKPIEV